MRRRSFSQLAAAKGTAPRQILLRDLLGRATPLEAKYLIKLMLSDMRIGVKQAQVEEAIAVAMERDLVAVRRALMLLGDLSEVVRLAAANRLDEARMRLFHPLGFMLASPVDSVAEAMARFAEEIRAEQKGKGGAQPVPEAEEPPEQHAIPEIPPANRSSKLTYKTSSTASAANCIAAIPRSLDAWRSSPAAATT